MKAKLMKLMEPISHLRDYHAVSLVMLTYGLIMLDHSQTMGSALYIESIFGESIVNLGGIGMFAISWRLLFGVKSPHHLLMASVPQFIYSMFAVQWYIQQNGVPIAGFALHITISALLIYIIFNNAREEGVNGSHLSTSE